MKTSIIAMVLAAMAADVGATPSDKGYQAGYDVDYQAIKGEGAAPSYGGSDKPVQAAQPAPSPGSPVGYEVKKPAEVLGASAPETPEVAAVAPITETVTVTETSTVVSTETVTATSTETVTASTTITETETETQTESVTKSITQTEAVTCTEYMPVQEIVHHTTTMVVEVPKVVEVQVQTCAIEEAEVPAPKCSAPQVSVSAADEDCDEYEEVEECDGDCDEIAGAQAKPSYPQAKGMPEKLDEIASGQVAKPSPANATVSQAKEEPNSPSHPVSATGAPTVEKPYQSPTASPATSGPANSTHAPSSPYNATVSPAATPTASNGTTPDSSYQPKNATTTAAAQEPSKASEVSPVAVAPEKNATATPSQHASPYNATATPMSTPESYNTTAGSPAQSDYTAEVSPATAHPQNVTQHVSNPGAYNVTEEEECDEDEEQDGEVQESEVAVEASEVKDYDVAKDGYGIAY